MIRAWLRIRLPKDFLISLECIFRDLIISAGLAALKILETSSLDWTFICPPTILDKDFTGNYITAENSVPENNLGEINAGDLADCMLKVIEKKQFIKAKAGITKAV